MDKDQQRWNACFSGHLQKERTGFIWFLTDLKPVENLCNINKWWVKDIKGNLKLFNNTRIFEPNISVKHFPSSPSSADGSWKLWLIVKKSAPPSIGKGHSLSKIYDSLLETPIIRMPPRSSSRSELVSLPSAEDGGGFLSNIWTSFGLKMWMLLNSFESSILIGLFRLISTKSPI